MKPATVLILLLLSFLILGNGTAAGRTPAIGDFDYAIVHYNRPADDYGDHTTGDFNNFWGLHLWGDGLDSSELTGWETPKPFLAEDDFGRFAWIRRAGSGSGVSFILHKGDVKDGTDADRFFDGDATPEIWINAGDPAIYTSQADAQGFVTIHYQRGDGDYGDPTSPDFNDFWGLHLWGDAVDPSEITAWPSPKPPTGIDGDGAFWEVLIVDSAQPVNFIIHRGDAKDPGPDDTFTPLEMPTAWKQSGDVAIYPTRGAAEQVAIIHYHRNAGDYGDPTSADFNDFWGLQVWDGSLTPSTWLDPVRWDHLDIFGPVFEIELVHGAPSLAYILHRGDTKDPGPDQSLVFDDWGYEVWQLEGADPAMPYVYPIGASADSDGDGVVDLCDSCPGTSIPESTVPSVRPGKNRFALIDGDLIFDTRLPKGKGPVRSYSLTETGGCSCEQIIALQGLDGGQVRFGCSVGTMEDWIALITGVPVMGGSTSGFDRTGKVRTGYVLRGNYPNPFNPRTTIRFDLPEAASVRLVVYDVQGRRVRVLADGPRAAGPHEVLFEASGLPSGWYLARLETPQGNLVRVMQLVK
jgi:hypothetical protein